MELSEKFIKQLESEGFSSVYEWQDKPGTVYEEHSHEDKTSLYVTDGEVIFSVDGQERRLTAGDRLDVPANTPHGAVVGPEGCIMVIGENE